MKKWSSVTAACVHAYGRTQSLWFRSKHLKKEFRAHLHASISYRQVWRHHVIKAAISLSLFTAYSRDWTTFSSTSYYTRTHTHTHCAVVTVLWWASNITIFPHYITRCCATHFPFFFFFDVLFAHLFLFTRSVCVRVQYLRPLVHPSDHWPTQSFKVCTDKKRQ